MKRLLVLGAGLLQIPVIKKAKEMGIFTIAVDDDEDAPGMMLCDKSIVCHITNPADMLEIAKQEHINGVIHPCSEVAMNSMGMINEKLHLPGLDRETVVKATNKHCMRKAFSDYGAPSPKSFGSVTLEEAKDESKKLKSDIIIKPSRNSGSRGVTKLGKGYSQSQFDKAFKRAYDESRDKSVVIEDFIEGPEFSVEIIIWQRQIHVLTVTDKKTTGSPYFVELGHNQPSLFNSNDIHAIKSAAIKGVKALGLDNCAVHAEVKLAEDGPYIMEIGARLGGDFISTELTHLSTGIDMVAAAINVALGEEPDLTPKHSPQGVAIRYFTPKPGILKLIENLEYADKDYVYQFEIYPKVGDEIREVKSSLDRSGHVIVTALTPEEAINRADDIIANVKLITE
jgi:biotin carboxylase